MKGLAALAKKSSEDDEAPESGADVSSVDSFLVEAFAAVKDNDKAAFVEALRGAIDACMTEE